MDNQSYQRTVSVKGGTYTIYDIRKLEAEGIAKIGRLPFSIRILVENLLRKLDGKVVTQADLKQIANWQKTYAEPAEIPFHPARVLMQDFTGVPAVVDLAAMRDAVKSLGGDPSKINPLIPSELVVDHSVQVDYYGTINALTRNVAREYERNGERYALLKWAQKSFHNFSVVPPSSGICHQVNLEHLGRVVITDKSDSIHLAYPDSLLGMDSHTTMINGIGVMGWGVGGIEAEAVMLGQPYFMTIPEVIGVKMTGKLPKGVNATDLVLRVTEILRKYGVVEKFVEFFGPGMKGLTVPDRATIANMSPEYGATMGFFPVDEKTVQYLRMTDRNRRADLVEVCAREMGLFYTGENEAEYTQVLELDLSTIEPAMAGPSRPQDRIPLKNLKERFFKIMGCEYERDTTLKHISRFYDESGNVSGSLPFCTPGKEKGVQIELGGKPTVIGDGSVVIAAITSCTNTSNPFVLIGAGLLAKNAVKRGLKIPLHVKTSFAPGSKVVNDYLEAACLVPYLEALGFHTVGFGCTTCIGNSGPLHPQIERAVVDNNLTVASVLSGNRNFEARIHQNVRANFLASPMLVVAFAIAGRVDLDLENEPLALDINEEPVYLKEIWPEDEEINALIPENVKEEFFRTEYGRIFDGDEFWQAMNVEQSTTYKWDETSSYIKNPPYFEGFSLDMKKPEEIEGAKVLALLGDTVTTDHISPAGAIPEKYPAGQYLVKKGVEKTDFNSYGSRRGNHEVMMRGTFGNIRIKNRLARGKEGSLTVKFPEKEEMYIYDAAMKYKAEKTPLIVIGGKEYGTGSSRDWAAKGTNLLGVKAVIAVSYERIHRSNLVGMGVLPLVFKEGENADSLGLDGSETYTIKGLSGMAPRKSLQVTAQKENREKIEFEVISKLNTDIDVAYYEHGGILPYVLRKLMREVGDD